MLALRLASLLALALTLESWTHRDKSKDATARPSTRSNPGTSHVTFNCRRALVFLPTSKVQSSTHSAGMASAHVKPGESSTSTRPKPASIPLYLIDGVATVWDAQGLSSPASPPQLELL